MANPRRRRLIRWAAVGAVLLVLSLVWVSTRESPALRLSQSIRPGMTRAEVELILGRSAVQLQSDERVTLLYGKSQLPVLMSALAYQLGIDTGGDMHVDNWPVEIWFDNQGARVTRVQRRVPGRDPALFEIEE